MQNSHPFQNLPQAGRTNQNQQGIASSVFRPFDTPGFSNGHGNGPLRANGLAPTVDDYPPWIFGPASVGGSGASQGPPTGRAVGPGQLPAALGPAPNVSHVNQAAPAPNANFWNDRGHLLNTSTSPHFSWHHSHGTGDHPGTNKFPSNYSMRPQDRNALAGFAPTGAAPPKLPPGLGIPGSQQFTNGDAAARYYPPLSIQIPTPGTNGAPSPNASSGVHMMGSGTNVGVSAAAPWGSNVQSSGPAANGDRYSFPTRGGPFAPLDMNTSPAPDTAHWGEGANVNWSPSSDAPRTGPGPIGWLFNTPAGKGTDPLRNQPVPIGYEHLFTPSDNSFNIQPPKPWPNAPQAPPPSASTSVVGFGQHAMAPTNQVAGDRRLSQPFNQSLGVAHNQPPVLPSNQTTGAAKVQLFVPPTSSSNSGSLHNQHPNVTPSQDVPGTRARRHTVSMPSAQVTMLRSPAMQQPKVNTLNGDADAFQPQRASIVPALAPSAATPQPTVDIPQHVPLPPIDRNATPRPLPQHRRALPPLAIQAGQVDIPPQSISVPMTAPAAVTQGQWVGPPANDDTTPAEEEDPSASEEVPRGLLPFIGTELSCKDFLSLQAFAEAAREEYLEYMNDRAIAHGRAPLMFGTVDAQEPRLTLLNMPVRIPEPPQAPSAPAPAPPMPRYMPLLLDTSPFAGYAAQGPGMPSPGLAAWMPEPPVAASVRAQVPPAAQSAPVSSVTSHLVEGDDLQAAPSAQPVPASVTSSLVGGNVQPATVARMTWHVPRDPTRRLGGPLPENGILSAEPLCSASALDQADDYCLYLRFLDMFRNTTANDIAELKVSHAAHPARAHVDDTSDRLPTQAAIDHELKLVEDLKTLGASQGWTGNATVHVQIRDLGERIKALQEKIACSATRVAWIKALPYVHGQIPTSRPAAAEYSGL